MQRVLLLFLLLEGLRLCSSQTNSQDVTALQALMRNWQNEPQSWAGSTDPCTSWDGISCSSGRVTELRLAGVDLQGTLSNAIDQLSALTYLDLSNNPNLGGPLTPNIGNLKQLTNLILLGCSFTGNIPEEIGNLTKLTFLALNSNNFTGVIPPTLGRLSDLIWLDLSDNQLSGQIPVSPGLNQLVNTQHFHFSQNQLTGTLSESLFSANMSLIHAIFDYNKLSGPIPRSIGLVPNLTIIRLDQNQFSGPVPSSISNLRNLMELSLASNLLNGSVPDLTNATQLNYLDLSNNDFTSSPAPSWVTELTSLNTLFMDNDRLTGTVPRALFSLPDLQQLSLARNAFDTLDMRVSISSTLRVVNLTRNRIITPNLNPSYNQSLILTENPACLENARFCTLNIIQLKPYATSLGPCAAISCPLDQSANLVPSQSCACTNPFRGLMIFRAPAFSDMTNPSAFQPLESTLAEYLTLEQGSVALSDVQFSPGAPLIFTMKIFPGSGTGFNKSDIIRISSALVNQTYKAPRAFGPYSFIIASTSIPSPSSKKSSMSKGAIIGIVIGGFILVAALVLAAMYALRQKRIAKEAVERTTNPFASWGAGGKDNGDAPQMKGARYFSFDELKKCTNNFSESHAIGSGGYGKVYKGTLENGRITAIKRAQQGSMQGAAEFKNEIELLSRVHHKNLVSLVGFCYEQGEQMLVYEYIPNGTLRDNLTGKGGIHLDWKKRLSIAIGSAKGLSYLHELADPPIIHRDVKSTNILLDESLNAKVADFGLSKLVSDTQKGHVSTQVKGTLGYLDPEYYMTQQLSEKSDVYSFGVVMLELVTARQPIEKGKYIVREIKTAIDQYDQEYYGLKALIDPSIRDSAKLVGFRRFVQLAIECVEESAADRPTMNDVVKELEVIIQNEEAGLLNSASLSIDRFGNGKGGDLYAGQLPVKDESSSSTFDYNSVYSYSAVEPK